MALLILAFVAGILTSLAPCVLPLLPIIVGGSVTADKEASKSRAYVIAFSLAISLFLFTILLKASTALVGVSPNVWLYTSGAIVVALGLVSLFPHTWEVAMFRLGWQSKSAELLDKTSRTSNRALAPILTGAALGPVFSSCSPTYAFILATVLPRSSAKGVFYLIAYCLGLVIAMLAISLLGRKALNKFRWAADPYGWFRRALGVLFIVVGISVAFGYDKKFEVYASAHLPFDISRVDQSLLSDTAKNKSTQAPTPAETKGDASVYNVKPYTAPEFTGLTNWINSDPQTVASLKGKVVLVDFWTYSCINCVRTLPHLKDWYSKYNSEGFTIIGVHAPEFSFEHDPSNVRDAVKKDGINYPVALDNNYGTWNAYQNEYWPAHYLIDKTGKVVNVHFGEGDYDKTEHAIKTLLGDNSSTMTNDSAASIATDITPETYFGYQRQSDYEGKPDIQPGSKTFTPAISVSRNDWTLSGGWTISGDQITSNSADSKISFHVHAKNVYVVASGDSGSPPTMATIDGSHPNWFGSDNQNGSLSINHSDIYNLATFAKTDDATITLTVPQGVSLNTFTFG